MPQNAGLSKADAQAQVIALIGQGSKVENAMRAVGRTRKAYENWRSEESDFSRKVDESRERFERASEGGRDTSAANLGFEEWRKRFLGRDTYPHQRMWIDVLEGRDPEDLHPSIRYEPRQSNYLLVNTPPFHCAEVSTPILTANRGWTTVGDVQDGDRLYSDDGLPWPVVDTWRPEADVELFDVRFNTGDVVRTDAQHLWVVEDSCGRTREVTTRWLMDHPRYSGVTKWSVPVARNLDPLEYASQPSVDPYLLGYWLGDGDTAGSRLSVSVVDLPALRDELEALNLDFSVADGSRSGDTNKSVYVKKVRSLLPLGNKRIPEEFFAAKVDDRLALLQGLMDTDGTINPRDGRASFIQVKYGLALDVYRLVASLGMQPRIRHEKQGATAPNGKPSSDRIWRIYFKPNDLPVFRLQRKLQHQKSTVKNCRTNRRQIDSVAPVGMGQVKCITVASPGNLFLIGDALIPTHNAKSTVITTEYVVYRICMNPNVRVKVISKTQEKAKDFLYSIKRMLTGTEFAELQAAYAPVGKDGMPSFKTAEGTWSSTKIYIAGRGEGAVDAASKDPTVEVLGIKGQIYGARADLIVVDDAVTMENANDHEKQIRWLRQEVASRLFGTGRLLVVGTRVASVDLYSELRNGDNFLSGESNWTYLSQPAVLEFSDDPKDWVTLWPRSSQPMDESGASEVDEDGLYPAWNGPNLDRVRAGLDEKTWGLVFMQVEIAEDTVFHPKCVNGSVNGQRKPGPLIAGAFGHPPRGPEGKHIIGSIDPAGTGEAFILIYAVDRQTKHRYVLDCFMANHTTPEWYASQIEALTPEHGVKEWVIEQNAYASWIIHDERIMKYCRDRGLVLSSHYTSRNKQDPDFGVASMASLFGQLRRIQEGGREEFVANSNIIHLPDKHHSTAIQALVTQLIQWQPGKLGRQLRQDGPMALWFAELRARNYIGEGAKQQQSHMRMRFMTDRHRRQQVVIPAGFIGEMDE